METVENRRPAKRAEKGKLLSSAERQDLDCTHGSHGLLIYGLVTEVDNLFGRCVQRDLVCLHCGSVVGHESWTWEAWDHRGQFRRAPGPDR